MIGTMNKTVRQIQSDLRDGWWAKARNASARVAEELGRAADLAEDGGLRHRLLSARGFALATSFFSDVLARHALMDPAISDPTAKAAEPIAVSSAETLTLLVEGLG